MIFALMGLIILSFITVTGAYARRACTFEESPLMGDDCGSLWSPTTNFLYTAFSRAIWSICISILMYLCLEDNNEDDNDNDNDDDEYVPSVSITNIVKSILCYKLWTPIAHLSFGSYLIHPIVIYYLNLGGREKITFRIFTYVMDVCSITVVTFVLSFIVTILIEFPFGILLQQQHQRPSSSLSVNTHPIVPAPAQNDLLTTKEQHNMNNNNRNDNDNHNTEMSSLLLESQSYNGNSSWQQHQQQQQQHIVDSTSSSISYGSLRYQDELL
jgi:uncharacterized membrane protein